MNKNNILELLNAEPFRPFFIHSSSGRSLQVSHPEQAILLPGKVVVYTGYRPHEAEGMEHISYLHVSSLQEN